MSLFIILTLITLLDAYKNKIIYLISKLLFRDSRIPLLTTEIKLMEKELNTISMIHEFAKHAKLQRKINNLKKKKKDLVVEKSFKILKLKYLLTTVAYVIIIASLIALIWWYRSESVVKVPEHWLWPVSSFFDWSYYTPGSITVPCWIAISSSASKTLAKHF